MKNIVRGIILLLAVSLLGCSLFPDKPSDIQIKKDIEQYFITNYKQLKISDIALSGIIFTKEDNINSRVATAIIIVTAQCTTDINIEGDPISDFLSLNKHKKGDIIQIDIKQKYLKTDRAWLEIETKVEQTKNMPHA